MFENPRRGRQARNFTTNVPKILDLKSSSEQIFSRKLSLGAPVVKANLKKLPLFSTLQSFNAWLTKCKFISCAKQKDLVSFSMYSSLQVSNKNSFGIFVILFLDRNFVRSSCCVN